MISDRVKYWTEISDYDIETAHAMLQTGRYLYVGFMCHQAIEKIIKAYWSKNSLEMPPKSHNLIKLSAESGLDSELNDDQKNTMSFLMPLNIESRYPSYKDHLTKILNKTRCQSILEETQNLQQWIKEKLSE